MTTIEKYLELILPTITAGIEGGEVRQKMFGGLRGYELPCPYCAPLQKRGSKKRERCAAFIPKEGSFTYLFHCCRKKHPDCQNTVAFPVFLKTYNPSLFKRYHLERVQKGSTGKGYDLPAFGSGQFWSPSFNSGDQSTSISFQSPDNHSSSSD